MAEDFRIQVRRRSKKTSKLRITGLCWGNSPVTSEFPHKGQVMRKMFPFDDSITDKAILLLFVNYSTLGHRFKTSSLLYSFTSLKTVDAHMRGPGQHLSGRDLIGTNSSPRLCWLTWIVFSNLKNKFQWCLKNIPFNGTRLVILSVHFVQHSVFQNIPMRSYGHWILRSCPLACVCVCLWNQKIASIREMSFCFHFSYSFTVVNSCIVLFQYRQYQSYLY